MLIASLLTLCLSAVFAAPSLNQQLDDHWHLWKSWHEKNYHEVGSIESVAEHKSIFNTIEKQHHDSLYTELLFQWLPFLLSSSERRGLEENGVGEELEEN